MISLMNPEPSPNQDGTWAEAIFGSLIEWLFDFLIELPFLLLQ